MRQSRVLDQNPTSAFNAFVQKCKDLNLNYILINGVAQTTIKYLRATKKQRQQLRINQILEQRWYDSLKQGEPDWGVYGHDLYVADLWACWIVYSRGYLKAILSDKSLPSGNSIVDNFGKVSKIVDLGCGIGYTTATLKQLFPEAAVYGTNFEGISQTEIAKKMGGVYGFAVLPDVSTIKGRTDFVMASEYFEHIPEPITHLRDILTSLKPRHMLIANAFGAKSTGHFDSYLVDGQMVDPRATSAAFSATMREHGYKKVKTNLWNNRPSYWAYSG